MMLDTIPRPSARCRATEMYPTWSFRVPCSPSTEIRFQSTVLPTATRDSTIIAPNRSRFMPPRHAAPKSVSTSPGPAAAIASRTLRSLGTRYRVQAISAPMLQTLSDLCGSFPPSAVQAFLRPIPKACRLSANPSPPRNSPTQRKSPQHPPQASLTSFRHPANYPSLPIAGRAAAIASRTLRSLGTRYQVPGTRYPLHPPVLQTSATFAQRSFPSSAVQAFLRPIPKACRLSANPSPPRNSPTQRKSPQHPPQASLTSFRHPANHPSPPIAGRAAAIASTTWYQVPGTLVHSDPVIAPIAEYTSSRPYPSPAARIFFVFASAALESEKPIAGCTCTVSAAAPATNGALNDVPVASA